MQMRKVNRENGYWRLLELQGAQNLLELCLFNNDKRVVILAGSWKLSHIVDGEY